MLFTPPTLALEAVRPAAASAALAQAPGLGTLSIKQDAALGTARSLVKSTDVRTASGWLSARRPLTFMAMREKSLGTELLSRFQTMVRAASGWLSARPSGNFLSNDQQNAWLGTARRSVETTGACAASGWLSAQAPDDFTTGNEQTGGYHLPVFPLEVAEWMQAGEGGFIIDGTLGGGGHSEIFLKAGASVLGIDRDPEALAHARARLAQFRRPLFHLGGEFFAAQGNSGIREGGRADGLLLDLGVSSRQLDSAPRGFSFMREGPLDMRMGPSSPHTAAEVVNEWE
jgi:hypothetical protein